VGRGPGFRPEARTIEGRNRADNKLTWCRWTSTEGDDDDHPDGQTAQHVIRAIERMTSENRPWIVGAGFLRPHDPFIAGHLHQRPWLSPQRAELVEQEHAL